MRLRATERDWYTLEISSDPAVGVAWEASFDREVTWVAPTIVTGLHRWLVAGDKYVADPGDTTPAVVITRTTTPMLRAVAAPVTAKRLAPTITYVP
jgi:hypothetical protein